MRVWFIYITMNKMKSAFNIIVIVLYIILDRLKL